MKKICAILVCLLIYGSAFINVFAANNYGSWWDGAGSWWDSGETTVSVDNNVLSGISNMVEVIGTGIIAIVTLVLGVKYMISSATGKSEVKENLMGLVVACAFFFGWSSIRDLLIVGNSTGQGGIDGSTTHLIFFNGGNLETTFSQIFSFILVVAKFICVAVIAYNGVKYILAGSEAKAQLKQKMPIMIIGIILIFCTATFIQFIASTITESLN